MRIVLICPQYLSPSEVFIGRQARALQATVLTFRRGENDEFISGVEVAFLPDGERRPPLMRYLKQGLEERLLGITSYYWANSTRSALREHLVRAEADVVVIHYGPLALQVAPECHRLAIPVVVHFHGYDLSRAYRRAGYRRALRRMARQVAGCVGVNDAMRNRLLGLGYPDASIRVIPYGVPLQEFVPAGDPGRNPCRFLAAGRLTEKKSPFDTIRAFAYCLGEHPDARLTLVGFGELEAQTRALISTLHLENKVEMPGAVTTRRMAEFMRSASVFVQHSVTARDGDEEGWPVAIAEACATGLPVVSTRHAGIPDQVIEGKSGFLVKEHDWRAMGARMLDLARDPELRRSFGKTARAHIERVGGFHRQIEALRAFLARCAGLDAVDADDRGRG